MPVDGRWTYATINRAFTEWAEEQYNAHEHSILGMAPLDRYALDLYRRPLPDTS